MHNLVDTQSTPELIDRAKTDLGLWMDSAGPAHCGTKSYSICSAIFAWSAGGTLRLHTRYYGDARRCFSRLIQTALELMNLSRLYATLPAFRHRNYRLYSARLLLSLARTWMQDVAQAWLVYRLPGSASILGIVAL